MTPKLHGGVGLAAYARRIARLRKAALRYRRQHNEAKAEVWKAMEAMGLGADDTRWEPGTTAIDALIHERDEAERQRDAHAEREALAQKQLLEAETTIRSLLNQIKGIEEAKAVWIAKLGEEVERQKKHNALQVYQIQESARRKHKAEALANALVFDLNRFKVELQIADMDRNLACAWAFDLGAAEARRAHDAEVASELGYK